MIMKSAIGIFLGVILGIIIVASVVVSLLFFGIFPSDYESSGAADTPAGSTSVAVTPSPLTVPPVLVSPPPATISPARPPASTVIPYVNFDLSIISLTGSGYTRVATARVTNTGTIDAHNVLAQIEVFSQGSRVKVNGQDSLIISLGTIKAGTSITTQATLSFSFTDGVKIAENGANVKITLISDERTQTITY